MMKIAVCDDEPVICEKLKNMISAMLNQWKETFAVTCYTNGARLLVSPLDFDLIFLDIRLPGPDGMTLARTLRLNGFEGDLVFVTGFPEYMPDAFEVEALDYLCKPIDPVRLEAAIKRSIRHLETRTEESLLIRTMNWCRTVKIRDICYCEVIDRKLYLHTRNGVMNYYGKMKELEKQAGSRLFKCHRSYLINLDYLLEYRNGMAVLGNGEQIPVAKSCRRALMERMMEYMDREG